MTKYKYLFIASGATPIGSAVRAPDRYEKLEKEWQYSGIKCWAYNQAQVLGCRLGGYSHRERCSRARCNYKKKVNIYRNIQITLHILPSRGKISHPWLNEMCYSNSRKSTRQYILRAPKSRINLWMPQNFAKVRPQIRSERRGTVSDVGLLLFSVSTDTKKNPNGRVRYPIKYDWDSTEW